MKQIYNFYRVNSLFFQDIISLMWFFAWIWLIEKDTYQTYLQPRFKILIFLSVIILFLFLYSRISKTYTHIYLKDAMGTWFKGLFLILSVFFMFISTNNTLGTYALTKRQVDMSGSVFATRPSVSDNSDKNILSAYRIPELTLSELFRNVEKYKNKKVITEGLYTTPERIFQKNM